MLPRGSIYGREPHNHSRLLSLVVTVSPVIGGFLTQAKGWRWLFWLSLSTAGDAFIAGVVVLRESNPSVLLQRKTKRLRT